MRKIKLFIATSLDNFIARSDGGIDWLFSDGDYGYKEFYDSISTILMGRKTYELALKLGERFAEKTYYVFSRSKQHSPQENVTFVSDPVNFTKELVKKPGKDIFLEGGGEIVSMFLNNSLIDEIIVSIHPILLGSGIPLFGNLNRSTTLKILKTIPFESGLIQVHYRVIK